MRGKTGFARIAGIVALGGAFYTATYITSYPGGTPKYAVLGLLAGTAAGIIACAMPRSATALTMAAVMLGFAFTGAVIHSGMGFLPGFVLMIMAARRASQPDAFAFLEQRREADQVPSGARSGTAGSFAWMRLEQGDAAEDRTVVLPEAGDVVSVPDADAVVTIPEAAAAPAVSRDGLVQAGPPGVIGMLPDMPRQRPRAEGFS